MNIHRNTVGRWSKDKTRPNTEELQKIAAVTGRSVQWLLDGSEHSTSDKRTEPSGNVMPAEDEVAAMVRMALGRMQGNLPVFGTAAASVVGADIFSGEVHEYVMRPPGLQNSPDGYALKVRGRSMVERFLPNDLIFVDPGRPVRSGDIVVVQTQYHESEQWLAWLKEYVRTLADGTLVSRQYNPDAEVKFVPHQVRAMHRVLTNNEVFGVT